MNITVSSYPIWLCTLASSLYISFLSLSSSPATCTSWIRDTGKLEEANLQEQEDCPSTSSLLTRIWWIEHLSKPFWRAAWLERLDLRAARVLFGRWPASLSRWWEELPIQRVSAGKRLCGISLSFTVRGNRWTKCLFAMRSLQYFVLQAALLLPSVLWDSIPL